MAINLKYLILGVIALLIAIGFWQIVLAPTLQEEKELKNLIDWTPNYKISSARTGMNEIAGKVMSAEGSLFDAPLSNRKGVYFQFRAERKGGSGVSWYKMGKAGVEKAQKFYLEDETGKIVVDPSGCNMRLRIDYTENFKPPNEWPYAFKMFLDDHKVDYQGWERVSYLAKVRFNEYLIEPHDTIYVIGEIKEKIGENLVIGRVESENNCIISDDNNYNLQQNDLYFIFMAAGMVFAGISGIILFLGGLGIIKPK